MFAEYKECRKEIDKRNGNAVVESAFHIKCLTNADRDLAI